MSLTPNTVVVGISPLDNFVHAGRQDLLLAHAVGWTPSTTRLDFFVPSGERIAPVWARDRLVGFEIPGPAVDPGVPFADPSRVGVLDESDPAAVLTRLEAVLKVARGYVGGHAAGSALLATGIPEYVDDLPQLATRLAIALELYDDPLPDGRIPNAGGWFHNLQHRISG